MVMKVVMVNYVRVVMVVEVVMVGRLVKVLSCYLHLFLVVMTLTCEGVDPEVVVMCEGVVVWRM